MKIALKNLQLTEIITKQKIDLISQNADRKSKIDSFIEMGLLKADDKGNYFVYNPYNEGTKYPNIEKFLEFLIKIYTNHEIDTENPFEDLDILEDNLKTFEDLKKRNIIPADIKNKHINKFTYDEIKTIIRQYTGQGEDSKISLNAITKLNRDIEMEELPNIKPPFKVLKVNDVSTATRLAKGASWCVSEVSHAKSYLISNPERGPLYFVYKNDYHFALFSFGKDLGRGELMNNQNTRISALMMQEVKDHWSNLLDYLHAFNIHEYDTDLSNFTTSLNDYLNSKEYIPNPVSLQFSDVLQYADEQIMSFFTKRDFSFIKDKVSSETASKINNMDSKELSKNIFNIVKSEMIESAKELSNKIEVTVYPVMEKGVVTLNLKYSEMFTYADKGYDSNSVDALIKKGNIDIETIVDTRIKHKMNKIKKHLDRFSTVLTYDTIDKYFK